MVFIREFLGENGGSFDREIRILNVKFWQEIGILKV
jgi:hypothetical protein